MVLISLAMGKNLLQVGTDVYHMVPCPLLNEMLFKGMPLQLFD